MKIIILSTLILFFSPLFSQRQDSIYPNPTSDWSAWTIDSTFSESGILARTIKQKSKCPSTNCHAVIVVTTYKENGRVLCKVRHRMMRGCFSSKKRSLWLKGRRHCHEAE